MAYAFWICLRIKVLGFLDNSVTVQRLSGPWNINWGRTPVKYHLVTGHLSSAWKVTLQTFVLRVLIPDSPDIPGFAQSLGKIAHPLAAVGKGRWVLRLGFGNVLLARWAPAVLFSLPGPRVSQLGPPPHGPTGCRVLRHWPPSLSWLHLRFPDGSPDLLQRSHAAALISPEHESVEPGSLGVQPKAINHP